MQMKGLGADQERGKGTEGEREVMGTSGRGVKDNRKKSSSNKTTTDQIYIILYMYK